MRILIVIILMLLTALAHGQTHTFPGNNVFPSTSTTDFNAGATVDFTGATVTGLAAAGVTSVFTRTGAVVAASGDYSAFYQPLDTDLTTWAGLTPSANFQTMVPHTFAQMKTDLGLVIGTNVEAWSANLDAWSAIATSTKQAADANLTSWAAITRASGFDTYVTTPTSANLRGFVTDENGTGALLFSGATTPDFTTGITIGAAAASGKVVIGDGTKFAGSSYTEAAPGTSGNVMTSDGTNWTSTGPTTQVYAGASPPTTANVGTFTIGVTGVNLKAAATVTIFTVPTGRAFVATQSQILVTAVTTGGAGTQVWSIKESSAARTMLTGTTSASGTPVANQTTFSSAPGTTTGFNSNCAAGNAVQAVISTSHAGSTAVTGTVYVTGFYTQ